MKKIYYSLMLLLGGMFMINTSCSDDDEKDTMAPGQISNVRFVPNYGGGYFLYDIPEDPDFLYVRADYTVDSGEKVSKTSSTYNDTLFVEGFGQVKEYEVKLYSVDRNENVSAPVSAGYYSARGKHKYSGRNIDSSPGLLCIDC